MTRSPMMAIQPNPVSSENLVSCQKKKTKCTVDASHQHSIFQEHGATLHRQAAWQSDLHIWILFKSEKLSQHLIRWAHELTNPLPESTRTPRSWNTHTNEVVRPSESSLQRFNIIACSKAFIESRGRRYKKGRLLSGDCMSAEMWETWNISDRKMTRLFLARMRGFAPCGRRELHACMLGNMYLASQPVYMVPEHDLF